MEFRSEFLRDELLEKVSSELHAFLGEKFADLAPAVTGRGGPNLSVSRDLTKADFSLQLRGVFARLKKDADQGTVEVAEAVKPYFDAVEGSLISHAVGENGFLNLFIHRTRAFKGAVEAVLKMGARYGHSSTKSGQRVIIEHTSANPNGPLHIGNLRNSVIGSHLSTLLSAVGYEVRQHYFVNDLGAQIGLTALGYNLIYHKIEPTLKIDQWIGMIYACMNTLETLQTVGINLEELHLALKRGESVDDIQQGSDDLKTFEKKKDMLSTIVDIYARQTILCDALFVAVKDINIKDTAGKLNLKYENRDPETVKLFRSMVINCLSGSQVTLNTYGIKHDSYDFESELGWEKSNERVMTVLKSSPYFVPQTQSNEQGKPEGGHLLMDQFIADAGLATGKKGYMKNYPKFYVLRPDGSTLYTFRDVVYSLKKCSNADLVFNVIGAEQKLPQQKVALSLQILGSPVNQYHISYEIVKLTKGKMSGRRGRYVTADDLYNDLRETVVEVMLEKRPEYKETPEILERTSHEVATAAMKITLLSTPPSHEIMFDVAQAADPRKVSGPFLLYNCTRLYSIFRKFEKRVGDQEYQYQPLPDTSQVDFSLLGTSEWRLFLEFVLGFPNLILSIATPTIPTAPQLPEFHLNKLTDFCMEFTKSFSSYYNANPILQSADKKEDYPLMYARLYFVKAMHQVLINALRILTIEPVEHM